MARFLSVFSLLSIIIALQGCNTIEGAGEDIESVGEEISDGAS